MTSLNHVRGDTFSVLHTLQAPDQQARDLTGYQIIAVLEQRNGQAIATLELELLDQATLTGRFLLKSPDSSTWPLTRLRYKVRFIDPQGVVSTSGFIDVRVTLAHESDCCGSSDEPIQVSISHEIMIAETDPDQLQVSIGTVLTGGGSQALIVGNWDMRNVSASVYEVTTGCVVENQQLSALPSVDLPHIDDLGPYISATAELSADISIGVPALATDLFLFGLHDAASSVIEQVNQIMTGVMPAGLLMSLVSFGAGDYQISVFGDSMTNVPSSAIKDGLLNMHINDGVLSIEGVDDFAYNVPNNSMFGVVSLVQGEGTPSDMTVITSGQSAPAILPSDWFNGAVYRVTHGGRYANKTTLAGDFVTVIDDGADLIVVHADLPIDVSALLADEQAARMAADETERLARINADLLNQAAQQTALNTAMSALSTNVYKKYDHFSAFPVIHIVQMTSEPSSSNDDYLYNDGVTNLRMNDWYMLNRKFDPQSWQHTYRWQHVYRWNGLQNAFVEVPDAEVWQVINDKPVIFKARHSLFLGRLYKDEIGWMYDIHNSINSSAGNNDTFLYGLYHDPAKQFTGGYMSLEHVQRLQAVESLAQVNNLNLGDKADVVEVEGIAAQAETNRLALLTKADINALATLTTLVGTKADQSYVNDQIANLVGTDGQVLAAIQAIADELANAEGILEALDQTVANRVRFDVATQALTSLQKYNARTNIGAEEVGTAAMLVAQVTVASIGAATAAQGAKADTALQSGDVAPVALSGNYADLIGRPTLPTNTDGLNEGTSNQYFTSARVRAALMTGISFATATAVLATDGLLVAVGKLQAQISAFATVARTGSYNDLANKPVIISMVSLTKAQYDALTTTEKNDVTKLYVVG